MAAINSVMDWDVENDLWNQAEFTQKVAVPAPSIHVRNGRKSLYDDDDDDYVGSMTKAKPAPKMVRGRLINVKEDNQPGRENQRDVIRSIREAHGYIYSNASQENYVSCIKKDPIKTETVTKSKMPNLGFKKSTKVLSKSKKSSSSVQTEEYVTASSGSTTSSMSSGTKFKEPDVSKLLL